MSKRACVKREGSADNRMNCDTELYSNSSRLQELGWSGDQYDEAVRLLLHACIARNASDQLDVMIPGVLVLLLAPAIPLLVALIRGQAGGAFRTLMFFSALTGAAISSGVNYEISFQIQRLDQFYDSFYHANGYHPFLDVYEENVILRLQKLGLISLGDGFISSSESMLNQYSRIFSAYCIGFYSLLVGWLLVHLLERRLGPHRQQ